MRKRLIRKGMFETNSSSCHSIVIQNSKYDKVQWKKNTDEILPIYPGEFGWEEETYYDFETKASYCLTYAKAMHNEEYLKMMIRVIERMTGRRVAFIPDLNNPYSQTWGSIDHQSIEYSPCVEVFQSDESLENFLFNPASILIIDNDNH